MQKNNIILSDNNGGTVVLKLEEKGVAICTEDEDTLAVFKTEEDLEIFCEATSELLKIYQEVKKNN